MVRAAARATEPAVNLVTLNRNWLADLNLCKNVRTVRKFGHAQIVSRLEIDPQGRCGAEVTGQSQRGVGGDRTPTGQDFVQARLRDVQDFAQGGDGDTKWNEVALTQQCWRSAFRWAAAATAAGSRTAVSTLVRLSPLAGRPRRGLTMALWQDRPELRR